MRICSRALLTIFAATVFTSHGTVISFTNELWAVALDGKSFELTITPRDSPPVRLSQPIISESEFRTEAKLDGADLVVTIAVPKPQLVTFFAIPPENRMRAFILPTFEGRYVPATDPDFQDFLKHQGPYNTTADLSMPFIGLDLGGRTMTVLLENQFNNFVAFGTSSNRLTATIAHEFTPNHAPRTFTYRVHLGAASVIEPARYYREYLTRTKQFVPLTEKIRKTPNAEKLRGALQAYLWGDGISSAFLRRLKQDGIDRALLCTGDLNSTDDPLIARTAAELGFLFGPYDSYHSIHSPKAKDTWPTAQFDEALYETGAITGKDGSKHAGFQKKGFHLSSRAAQPYVSKRVDPILAKVPFSAWFVDCDAAGELFDNYDPRFATTQAEDVQFRCERMQWLTRTHNLIVGSEGGSAYAAGAIHFAHGMLTPVIGWGDPGVKDRKSQYWLGAYWPPTGPTIFTKQVPLKPEYQKLYLDPRYRLPLYEIAFHDSVVSTHHWLASSLKFSDQLVTTELIELLHNCPPLYHLNEKEYQAHRAEILRHFAVFSSAHRVLAMEAMTDFRFLTYARDVQQTTFANGGRITANFSAEPFQSSPPRSVVIQVAASEKAAVYTPRE